MKKIVLLILSVFGLFFLFSNSSVQSEESVDLEAELNDLIEKGYFSEDVTLEDYKLAKQEEAEGLAWIEEESRRFEEEQAQQNSNK